MLIKQVWQSQQRVRHPTGEVDEEYHEGQISRWFNIDTAYYLSKCSRLAACKSSLLLTMDTGLLGCLLPALCSIRMRRVLCSQTRNVDQQCRSGQWNSLRKPKPRWHSSSQRAKITAFLMLVICLRRAEDHCSGKGSPFQNLWNGEEHKCLFCDVWEQLERRREKDVVLGRWELYFAGHDPFLLIWPYVLAGEASAGMEGASSTFLVVRRFRLMRVEIATCSDKMRRPPMPRG